MSSRWCISSVNGRQPAACVARATESRLVEVKIQSRCSGDCEIETTTTRWRSIICLTPYSLNASKTFSTLTRRKSGQEHRRSDLKAPATLHNGSENGLWRWPRQSCAGREDTKWNWTVSGICEGPHPREESHSVVKRSISQEKYGHSNQLGAISSTYHNNCQSSGFVGASDGVRTPRKKHW